LFVLAMVLAGVLSRALDLVPSGISCSLGRIICACFVGLLAYPAGFFCVFAVVFGLVSVLPLSSHHASRAFELAASYLLLSGILVVCGMVTLAIYTGAFALSTRHWPKHGFRSMLKLVGVSMVGALVSGIIHYHALVSAPLTFLTIRNALGDPQGTVFGFAWGIPLVAIVGQPLFGGLIGHWLYLAAVEWSAQPA